MKRLLLFIALALCAVQLFAQGDDRDVLVTPDGTVYTVESIAPPDGSTTATSVIQLTTQNDDTQTSMVLPGSTTSGTNTLPALAYDADAKTLFVVWMHMPNPFSSELLLASFSDGQWQPAVSIDDQAWHLRYNLKATITRSIRQLQDDGSYRDVPALILHLLWWEETGEGEKARYALLNIENGHVTFSEVHSVSDFYTDTDAPATPDPNTDAEILRHPAFLETGSPDSVDVLAADTATYSFHRATIRPVLETRIRIPVGKGGGGRIAIPNSFSVGQGGTISVISSPHSDSLVLASVTATGVNYLAYSGGNWSTPKTIATGGKLNTDSALRALAKYVNAQ